MFAMLSTLLAWLVGGGNDNNIVTLFESVHQGQQLRHHSLLHFSVRLRVFGLCYFLQRIHLYTYI